MTIINMHGFEAHQVLTPEADVWDLVDPRSGDTIASMLCGDELDDAVMREIRKSDQ